MLNFVALSATVLGVCYVVRVAHAVSDSVDDSLPQCRKSSGRGGLASAALSRVPSRRQAGAAALSATGIDDWRKEGGDGVTELRAAHTRRETAEEQHWMRRQVLERCQEIDCKCQSGGKELNSDSDLANRALPRAVAMSERQPFASLPPGRCQPAAAVLVVEPPPHEHCLQGSPTRRVHDDREQHRRLAPASEKGDKRFVTSIPLFSRAVDTAPLQCSADTTSAAEP
ncbi:unnamed protein product [Heligmosomoides polygyrus]|uniref:Secreted protein n=1 Tax=Heligmosomoides polygyrus TaxID=6339 RepID=A0A183G5Q4_HELPZ|nr:unnamed protein product [Heligmosomoides polygyrus]